MKTKDELMQKAAQAAQLPSPFGPVLASILVEMAEWEEERKQLMANLEKHDADPAVLFEQLSLWAKKLKNEGRNEETRETDSEGPDRP